jgi:hypothetical protein
MIFIGAAAMAGSIAAVMGAVPPKGAPPRQQTAFERLSAEGDALSARVVADWACGPHAPGSQMIPADTPAYVAFKAKLDAAEQEIGKSGLDVIDVLFRSRLFLASPADCPKRTASAQ